MISKNRTIIYTRVSTKGQTCENQLIDLRRYAEARKLDVIEEIQDWGISGAKLVRPGLNRVLDLCCKRKVDIVLIWKLDRLFRNTKHCIQLVDGEMSQNGVSLISYTENMDLTDGNVYKKLLFLLLSSFSELEKNALRERVMAGLARARLSGKRLGRKPVHYNLNKLVELREQGLTLRQIEKKVGISKSKISLILKNEVVH